MMPLLQQYSWPGNVRELYNFSQRLQFYHQDFSAGADAKAFLAEILPHAAIEWRAGELDPAGRMDPLAELEKQKVEAALQTSLNSAEAASKLGISRATLWRKLKRWKQAEKT